MLRMLIGALCRDYVVAPSMTVYKVWVIHRIPVVEV